MIGVSGFIWQHASESLAEDVCVVAASSTAVHPAGTRCAATASKAAHLSEGVTIVTLLIDALSTWRTAEDAGDRVAARSTSRR